MPVRHDFPRKVKLIRDVFIPLSDGTRLAAQIWIPEDAEADKVPAILEYLPYRKRDGTADRDALTHPYFAGHGYACVRVDIRGSGDSEGVLLGEYLKQEQDDALEILDWICAQPWSTGRVGVIGISWGGFNGLQIAARQHSALQAVISLCSTDDRYRDDIHFMGGALLVDKLTWGSTMFAINSTPPDPALVGDSWRKIWMDRLKGSGLWPLEWHKQQRRTDLYTHGSIAEDYDAVKCPVYMVGGWADGYSNPIFRVLANLKGPRKGLIGPWAHKYPHFAKPGPQIGFLQESLRWWDKWLKDVETGIMDEPMLRVWMEDSDPPSRMYEVRSGRWVAEETWPSPRIKTSTRPLGAGLIGEEGEKPAAALLTISSPQTVGLAAGRWCPYGLEPDQAGDQRVEAGGSLVFDSAPLGTTLEILGPTVFKLKLASNKPNAVVAVTLGEVLPDGAVSRITYGILNLTHRNSDTALEALEPGTFYDVSIPLNDIAHSFKAGNRIRLAVSTSYWPIIWPSPEAATLTIESAASSLLLPVRPERADDAQLTPFAEPEWSEPVRTTQIEPAHDVSRQILDLLTDVVTVERLSNSGMTRYDDIDWSVGVQAHKRYHIKANDPLSAHVEVEWMKRYERGDFKIRTVTKITMQAQADSFKIDASLHAYENGELAFSQDWSEDVPRDHV
ncbi:hypothetical protein FHS85_003755 [Rhodoligotrophos appendicifer]|uniref:CocE/NonD family hydrolase n=1 Tax=Rhodoligotrophos appendicifer TaxID=987056 RepID=UPI0011872BF7|nr:CocE/NonD family hydrolase [Rhodoligotrophos appendicifer]